MTIAPRGRAASLPAAERPEAVSRLRLLLADSGTAPPDRQAAVDAPPIQAPQLLRPLLRGGQINRGSVVALRADAPRFDGGSTTYLALALAAAATAAGAWCGVLGFPSFGIAAAAGLGARLDRFLMLDHPGDRELDALMVLADGCDLVLWNAPHRLPMSDSRRVRARIRPADRRRGAVLVVMAAQRQWLDADLHLSTADPVWTGLGQGNGHLTGRLVTVSASGRGAAGHEPSARVRLPASDGTMQEPDVAELLGDVGQERGPQLWRQRPA